MGHKEHVQRINQELRAAGATSYGALKFASVHLPNVIYENEHIEAVVYGRYGADKSLGLLGMVEGMLVATDHRVVFLDHKPGYTAMDELTYYSVTGVQKVTAAFFSAVTLFTRTGNYTLRFANNHCAQNFVRHIELHHLGQSESAFRGALNAGHGPSSTIEKQALAFLKAHSLGVLSSIDPNGMVYGSIVYYLVASDNIVYTLAKENQEEQAHNILMHGQVALTTYDTEAAQTVQLKGTGMIETESRIRDHVLTTLAQLRTHYGNIQIPPAAQLRQWSYVVIRIAPTFARFVDYLSPSVGARLP